ncbi:hypothetical protein RHMOL_Rhmol02G0317000 [Rhododendron molle]|uniref:Uncharacterized protein n=1 Tax=Rhododendron molle TaxID=49168 RepID=A0ACC0PWT7_RHOML|nr:hypothetical protein RHMOL_Rhmol02G0317000 [Rhododendron molle]
MRLHSALTSFSFQIPKPHLPFRLASPGRRLLQWKYIISRVLDGKPLAVHVYDDNKNDVLANTWGLHPWMNRGGSQMTFHAGPLGFTLEITVPIMGALYITFALDGGKREEICARSFHKSIPKSKVLWKFKPRVSILLKCQMHCTQVKEVRKALRFDLVPTLASYYWMKHYQ